MDENQFRKLICEHYKKHGRHDLPWRKTKDPYKILVSEVMLQQTQVERVSPFYEHFLKQFPTVRKLAQAPLADVLKAWQGLGYNRRAKMLHQAARKVVEEYKGKFPKTRAELEVLPGIGPYTAGAVAAFAYNQDGIFIETNIRTAITHHYFPKRMKVSDKEIIKILVQVFLKGRSREWYGALMDYGAHLKRSGVKLNAKSKHYTKQSAFKGSLREARGAILRALAAGPEQGEPLLRLLGPARRVQLKTALADLVAEGMVCKNKRKYDLTT